MKALKIAVVGSNSDMARDLLPRLDQHELFAFPRSVIDVTSYNQCKRITDITPDVLINFAGILKPEYFHESNRYTWWDHIAVNLVGSYNVARAAIEANQNCKIIFIGSKAASSPRATRSAYCASKAGLSEMTKCLILEGVDVYVLNIGPCDTKMRQSLKLNENPDSILSPADISRRILKIIDNQEWQRVIWYDKLEA